MSTAKLLLDDLRESNKKQMEALSDKDRCTVLASCVDLVVRGQKNPLTTEELKAYLDTQGSLAWIVQDVYAEWLLSVRYVEA